MRQREPDVGAPWIGADKSVRHGPLETIANARKPCPTHINLGLSEAQALMLISAESKNRVSGKGVFCSMRYSGLEPSLRQPNPRTGWLSLLRRVARMVVPGRHTDDIISCHKHCREARPSSGSLVNREHASRGWSGRRR